MRLSSQEQVDILNNKQICCDKDVGGSVMIYAELTLTFTIKSKHHMNDSYLLSDIINHGFTVRKDPVQPSSTPIKAVRYQSNVTEEFLRTGINEYGMAESVIEILSI